jgi:hypothetical protein
MSAARKVDLLARFAALKTELAADADPPGAAAVSRAVGNGSQPADDLAGSSAAAGRASAVGAEPQPEVPAAHEVGLGRIVALYHRSSTSYQIC